MPALRQPPEQASRPQTGTRVPPLPLTASPHACLSLLTMNDIFTHRETDKKYCHNS